MVRDTLTDRQWERLQPLLPPQKPKTGHPAKDHRLVLNGILWGLRTGAPWRDTPPEYGPWQTLSTRRGGEYRSQYYTPAPSRDHFGPGSSSRVSLSCVTTV